MRRRRLWQLLRRGLRQLRLQHELNPHKVILRNEGPVGEPRSATISTRDRDDAVDWRVLLRRELDYTLLRAGLLARQFARRLSAPNAAGPARRCAAAALHMGAAAAPASVRA